MTPKVTLRQALDDPALLGSALDGPTWAAWRVILLAAMGEALTPDELKVFTQFTGLALSPDQRVDELYCCIGRRGGKSRAMAVLAVYLAALCDYRDKLDRGERGVLLMVAPDMKQARVLLDYAEGALESAPLLKALIANRTKETLELTNGIVLEVRSASFRRVRGITAVAVLADEAAFWMSEDSTNPDTEILNALRPTLSTTQGIMAVISSPYARRGVLWEAYRKHFGNDDDPAILVCQGSTRQFNPALPQSVVDRAIERDAAAANAEYLALFRTDIETFIPREVVEACVDNGVRERPPLRANNYVAFCDPSGGSNDSMTLAISHTEGSTQILDLVREIRPPFSPEAVVAEFTDVLSQYRCSTVCGDRYGGEWVASQFAKCRVFYQPADKSKSELYRDLLPLLNSKAVALLDNERLLMQLTMLERRTARGGKDSIDHPRGAHDDLANAVAGALTGAYAGGGLSSFRGPIKFPNQAVA